MTSHDVDRAVARWFESEARPAATADVLDRALRATGQRRPRPRLSARFGSHWIGDGAASPGGATLWRTGVRASTALVVLLLVVVALAGAVAVGARLLQPARVDLGIFAPIAGRIVYGDGRVIWGIDPAAPADRRTNIELTVQGTPLEWSSDGTRLLIMRGRGSDELLFVVDADGSETQVTERPMAIQGATISPDGSRVVYNDSGALYSVSADGGPVEILLRARQAILRDPVFAPDGTHIAYVDGMGDWGNNVWLVNVDGSDAHPIMTNETTDGAGHTSGLAWSPSGDRIALGLQGAIYTFAADGSGFTRVISQGARPYWSPDGSQIGYRVPCPEFPGACGLAIVDADGSDARTFGFGVSGPWHPGPLQTDETLAPVSNGWIAFTVGPAAGDVDDDLDIWLVALDREARRVVGSETDRVHQLCPAFSPDGRSLAYGRVEGAGAEASANADGTETAQPLRYRQSALVVADVSTEGSVADQVTIQVGDGLPPPCPVWSPDGRRVAFGVNRTSPINPETSAAGSEVWVVTLSDRGIVVLQDKLATDLAWSPDGNLLAIASGSHERVSGEVLQDGMIHLYDLTSGATRALEGTRGAVNVTWSSDGQSIAWAGLTGDSDRSLALHVVDMETGHQQLLHAGYAAIHGIGPVWSPDGGRIVYQRCIAGRCAGERHEVVLVTPGEPSKEGAPPVEVLVPLQTTAPGSRGLFPYRVTWSPDGQYLLYMGWERAAADSAGGLVAIPAALDGPPVVLAQVEGMHAYDGYPDTTLVPIQTWGRAPSE